MARPEIVDRDDELSRLHSLLRSGEPKLALIYGRRRVGKTWLLSRAWPEDVPSFYFTASETTPAQNREALVRAFAEWSGEAIRPEDHPTWRTVFRLLLDHDPTGPLVLTLDEFQYLGETVEELSSVASELNAVWERRRPRRPLVLVLSGSSVRILESLNEGGSPLYGRFAWQARLRPFDYLHSGELSGFAGLRDRAYAYGLFGGTPRYLAAIDPETPLAENAAALLLAPSGEVRELLQTALFQEQGLRDIPKYAAILRAIGGGRTELNEIAQAAGLSADPPLRRKIDRLIDLDYVWAGRNLGARKTEPWRYRVADPAFRFYYAFVAPIESALETQSPASIWKQHVEPALDGYQGLIFERMVEQAYYRLTESRDLPLVRSWGRWEGRDRDRRSLEIDVAAELFDGRVLTGSVKWNAVPVDPSLHRAHEDAVQRLARSGVEWAHRALASESPFLYVAAGGFTEGFRAATESVEREIYLWTLADLYESG